METAYVCPQYLSACIPLVDLGPLFGKGDMGKNVMVAVVELIAQDADAIHSKLPASVVMC